MTDMEELVAALKAEFPAAIVQVRDYDKGVGVMNPATREAVQGDPYSGWNVNCAQDRDELVKSVHAIF